MIKKIQTYFLLFLVIACTAQVGVTVHFCRGELIGSKLIFGEGKLSCGMKTSPDAPCNHKKILTPGCCEDFLSRFEFNGEFEVTHFTNPFQKKQGAAPEIINLFLQFPTPVFTGYHTDNRFCFLKAPPPYSVPLEAIERLSVFRI